MKEQWRAELKYTVGTAESRMLAARMAAFMERDIHGGKTGYLVRSLYFDNFYNKPCGKNWMVWAYEKNFVSAVMTGISALSGWKKRASAIMQATRPSAV